MRDGRYGTHREKQTLTGVFEHHLTTSPVTKVRVVGGGAENLGLPVDGLARLRLEHNGTAPRGVSKSFARRKDTCNILSYLQLVSAVFTPCAKNFLLA
jgi:hypothetical protein